MSLAIQQSPWLAHLVDFRIEDARFNYTDPNSKGQPIEAEIASFSICLDVSFDETPELITGQPAAECLASPPTSPILERPRTRHLPSETKSESPGLSPPLETNPPRAAEILLGKPLDNGSVIQLSAPPQPSTPPPAPLSPPVSTPQPRLPRFSSIGPAGLKKTRAFRLLAGLLKRAKGKATLSVELGPASISGGVKRGVNKALELIDQSRLDLTVQFGGQAGILGHDTVEIDIKVSPLSISAPQMLDLKNMMREQFPKKEKPPSKPGSSIKFAVSRLGHVFSMSCQLR